MSSAAMNDSTLQDHFEDDLNISIQGFGVEYPSFTVLPDTLDIYARRFFPASAAMDKTLKLNRLTGIDTRSSVVDPNHHLMQQQHTPTIAELARFFQHEGVRLAVIACEKAIREWCGNISEITHMVSTTCTHSGNPGFDLSVAKTLGLRSSVERCLLQGAGCSGGLAAIRTAASLALASSSRRKPARVLVLSCEITTTLVRSELESIDRDQEVRVGVTLFGDCASACIISNGVGEDGRCNGPIYDILGWRHETVPGTENNSRFDVDPLGWKINSTARVTQSTVTSVPDIYNTLLSSIPSLNLHDDDDHLTSSSADKITVPPPTSFDWALHPSGSAVITGIQDSLNLVAEDHLRATCDIYVRHGNSSSASVMAVLDRLRHMPQPTTAEAKSSTSDSDSDSDSGSSNSNGTLTQPTNNRGRKNVVSFAFGPGMSVEMCVLRRKDDQASPESFVRKDQDEKDSKQDQTPGRVNHWGCFPRTLFNGPSRMIRRRWQRFQRPGNLSSLAQKAKSNTMLDTRV